MAKGTRASIPKPPTGPRIGFWDVFYKHGASFAACAVLGLGIYCSKPGDIPELFKAVFGDDKAAIIGWTVAGCLLLTLVGVCFFGRMSYLAEIKRLAKERDTLQEMLGLKIKFRTEGENR